MRSTSKQYTFLSAHCDTDVRRQHMCVDVRTSSHREDGVTMALQKGRGLSRLHVPHPHGVEEQGARTTRRGRTVKPGVGTALSWPSKGTAPDCTRLRQTTLLPPSAVGVRSGSLGRASKDLGEVLGQPKARLGGLGRSSGRRQQRKNCTQAWRARETRSWRPPLCGPGTFWAAAGGGHDGDP